MGSVDMVGLLGFLKRNWAIPVNCIIVILVIMYACGEAESIKKIKKTPDKIVRDTVKVYLQPGDTFPKLSPKQVDSIRYSKECIDKAVAYENKHEIYGEIIREAKVICYLRETAKLKDPYNVNIVESSGIRYVGKYALSKDAIEFAETYWQKYHCYGRVGWTQDLLLKHHYSQELIMEDLLLYFVDECLSRGIKPTSQFIALCHWKGFNGALQFTKGGKK